MITSINKSIINQYLMTRIKNQQEFFLHPPYLLEQQLLNAIQEGNYTKAYGVLNKINSLERAKLAHHPIRSLKNSLICSCTLFTRAIIQGGVHPETAFNLSDVYILELERADDPKRLTELEYEMVAHFINTLKEEKKNTYNQTINRVLSYIHDNILQELSLHEIALQFNLTPNYLSQLFKKEVGTSLIEFINQKKIEESKYFLFYTDSSISDIALLFHFCNQSYYSSLFKKYTGLTPKKFRNMNSNIR